MGKSWLGDTTPAPRCIIDLEGRAKYTPSRPKILWDPRVAPPVYDGTWETAIVQASTFEEIDLAKQWIRSGQHSFISFVVDSVMEAQKRAMDIVVPGVAQPDQQNWGELLRRLEKIVRELRDTTLVANNTMSCVLLICGSKQDDKKGWVPMLQGQIQDGIPYYLDVVGYMYKEAQADGTFARKMLIDQQPGFMAKDNTDRLARQLGAAIPIADMHADPALGWTGYDIGQLMNYLHVNGSTGTTTQQEGAAA